MEKNPATYKFEKRKKEIARQKKQEEKRQRQLEKKQEKEGDSSIVSPDASSSLLSEAIHDIDKETAV